MAPGEAKNGTKTLHLIGVGVKHSIAPPMHNYIAKSLGLPWQFFSTEAESIDQAIELIRSPTCAGTVVTMPYKTSIMAHLDKVDDLARSIGACNNTYWQDGKIVGTNTDWIGIKGCLLEKAKKPDCDAGAPALIIGAGGASRAAAYALCCHLNVTTLYIINRDDSEVKALLEDTRKLSPAPAVVHVQSIPHAQSLEQAPYYIVGTVPDLEATTESERTVAAILEHFLSREQKGVLLDMCFKPRLTRTMKKAQGLGWSTVEGTHVIGYQIERQYELWAGKEKAQSLDTRGAWDVLLRSADESTAINF